MAKTNDWLSEDPVAKGSWLDEDEPIQAGQQDDPVAPAGDSGSIVDRAKSGFNATVRSAKLAGLASAGSSPEDIAQVIVDGRKTALPQTKDAAEIEANSAAAIKDYEESSGAAAIPAFLGLAGRRLYEHAKHPGETLRKVAENVSNSAPGLIGGIGGALAGGVAGPGGALAGGIAGGTAAGVIPEFGSELEQRVIAKVEELGLDPANPKDVAQVVRDNRKEFTDKALAKGITTSAVDAVLTRLTFGLGGMGERAIAKEAADVAKAVKAGTITAEGAAKQAAALEAKAAARNTLAQKVKRGGLETVGEMAGESTSEGLGRIATGDPFNAVEAIDEGVISLGQGAAMASGGKLTNKALGLQSVEAADAAVSELSRVLEQQKSKGNSPLSSAALAANPDLKVDPFAELTKTAEEEVRNNGVLDILRAQAPDRVPEFLAAFNVAKNKNAPASARQAAVDTLNEGIQLTKGVQYGSSNPTAPSDPNSIPGAAVDAGGGVATGLGAVDGVESDEVRSPETAVGEAAGLPSGETGPTLTNAAGPAAFAGQPINSRWTAFHPSTGTLNIPRAEMPQIKSEHRGAMVNFLKARGISVEGDIVPAGSLKPTQAEFSPGKVQKAKDIGDTVRPILVSSDGYVLDGHHQWMSKVDGNHPVRVARLGAPITELLAAMKDFPSAGMTKAAEPIARTEVPAPDVVAAPFSEENKGTAQMRKRKAQLQAMAAKGFLAIDEHDGLSWLVNQATNEEMALGSGIDVRMAQQAVDQTAKSKDNTTSTTGSGDGTNAGTASAGVDRAGPEALQASIPGLPRDGDSFAPEGSIPAGASGRNGQETARQSDATAVLELSRKEGRPIELADPSSPITRALDNLLDVFATLTGKRGIAVHDSSSSAFDGASYAGNFFVNVDKPQVHVAQTIAHEFKHLSERYPAIGLLYDRMWALIPQDAKQVYFEKYLEKGKLFTEATPQQLAKLKDEMLADFMGQRFKDKAWLQQLAAQKPNLFGTFVREWVDLLGKISDALRGIVQSRMSPGLKAKDLDLQLVGYIKELKAMKDIATEVAIAWAEKNPKLAQSTGADQAIQHSLKEQDIDLDFMAQLQAEMEAEQTANEKENLKDAIKAKGIHAEDAFGSPMWARDRERLQRAEIPDLYTKGVTSAIQLEPEGDLWGASMRGTWVGPSNEEKVGYATEKGVKDFVRRFVAAKELIRMKFDLADTTPKETRDRLVDSWKALAETDGAKRYGKSEPNLPMKAIAAKMGVTSVYDVSVHTENMDPENRNMLVEFTGKAQGDVQAALLELTKEGGKWYGTAQTSSLHRGGMGAAFYQMAAEYAAPRNIEIRPDGSLSGVNTYRRTEQMLSAAFRTGKSNVMTPAPTQRIYGFNNKASTEQEHKDNIARMLLAGLRNARELAPGLDALVYHPETGAFTDSDGNNKERDVKMMLMDIDARAFGLGRSTLARAVMTKMLMAGDELQSSSFKEPVLYSARDTAELEYSAIDAQYRGTPGFMKTPAGEKTKLTEHQWIQVRTPSFKKWFGDWEQGNIWGRDDVSKAVGENGEPMVMYHGTDKGGFMSFNRPEGSHRGDMGIFTTPDFGMARSYVRKGRGQEITEDMLSVKATKNSLADLGVIIEELDDGFYWDNESKHGPFATEQEAVDDAGMSLQDELDALLDPFPGIYATFVNLRNPYETDFEGALWSGARDHQWTVVVGGEIQSNAEGKQYLNEEEARALAKEFADPDDEYEGADYMMAPDEHYETTDSAAREGNKHGHDGTIVRNVIDDGGGLGYDMEPKDIFILNDPANIKSAEFNTGSFGETDDIRYSQRDEEVEFEYSKRDPSIGDKTDVAQLPVGKPIPESVGVGSLEMSLQQARSKTYTKGRQLKVDLQERVLAAAKDAGVDLTEKTQEAFKFLVGMVTRDAHFALQSNANAVGWYDKTVSRAIGALSTIHPEIATDPTSRLAFLWCLATTSNGMKVDKNFDMAEKAYRRWKATGVMPTDVGIGNAAQSIDKGLAAFNTLAEKMGHDRLFKFMATEFEVGQIGRMFGIEPGGEWMSTPVQGSAVLGPKIGNGFFSNLNGYFKALTIDRWLMRTWGRFTGTLIGVDTEKVVSSRKKLAATIASLGDAERRIMSKLIGKPITKRMSKAELDALSDAIAKTSMKVDKRAIMSATPSTNRLRLDGNGLSKLRDGQKEAPSGPAERNWMRAVFAQALASMKADGVELTMSDLQALLWYPERRLYDAAKSEEDMAEGYEDDEAPDYANAAFKLAKAQGIDEQTILAAMDKSQSAGTVIGATLTASEKEAMLNEFRSAPEQVTQLAFEVAPDPNDAALTAEWAKLSTEERAAITKVAQASVFDDIVKLTRVKVGKTVPATGGYMGLVNPNLITQYASKSVSIDQARTLAATIGYVLDQDSVALVDPRAQYSNGMVRITFEKSPKKHLDAIFQAIQTAIPEIDAFTSRGNNFDVLKFTKRFTIEELHDKIADVLEELGDTIPSGIISHGDVQSELVEKADYDDYTKGLRPGLGQEGSAGIDGLRDRARSVVAQEIRSASQARLDRGARADTRRSAVARRDAVQLSAREPASRLARPDGWDGQNGPRTVRAAIHYGKQAGLTTLVGSNSGTGIKGAEQARLATTTDPRLKKRVYFYLPTPGGIPQAEIGLGAHVYQSDIGGLYDPSTATQPIMGSGNAFESAVLDAGFRGYINPEQGTIVVLNSDVPVHAMGQVSEHHVIPRRIERTIQKVSTRAEGDEMVRRPDNTEVLTLVRNKKAIEAAAPSFRMEYGEARVKSTEAAAADSAIETAGGSFRFGGLLYSKRSQDEFDAEQVRQNESNAAPVVRKWSGLKAAVPVKIEDTGEVATLIMDVNQTLDDFDNRQANIEKLLECL